MRARVTLALTLTLGLGLRTCAAPSPGDCDESQTFARPGCGDPPPDAELVDVDCYTPCEAGSDCDDDQRCALVYYDPCAGDVCNACGSTTTICVD
ncbi:MAG: hypothetical protein H6713_36420 [Myxococcales bacterium]|nr:hypothetical protein [Myxococcales bacterium]